MATIRKRGNTYKIEVVKGRHPDGRKITESSTFIPDPKKTDRQNEKALQSYALEFEKRVKSGLSRGDSLTFQEFAEQWLSVYAEKELEPTTLATYTNALEKALFPRCGFLKLSAIRPMTIQDILNDCREKGYQYGNRTGKYSEETIRTFKIVLSSVLSAAVEDGLISQNPCIRQRQRHKKTAEKTIKCFTPEQAFYFMDVIKKPIPVIVDEHPAIRNGQTITIKAHVNREIIIQLKYQTFFIIAIFSGCRRGELVGLTWNNVDFANKTIKVSQSAAYTSKTHQYIGTPKTESGYRTIYLPDYAMKMLNELKREQRHEIILKGTTWIADRTQTSGFVFTQENGNMMAISTPGKEFRRIIKALNKVSDENNQLPEISLHDLRHTSASILISQGLDPVTVANRLGHSDPTITLRTYAHAFAEHDQKCADALEQAFMNVRNSV